MVDLLYLIFALFLKHLGSDLPFTMAFQTKNIYSYSSALVTRTTIIGFGFVINGLLMISYEDMQMDSEFPR